MSPFLLLFTILVSTTTDQVVYGEEVKSITRINNSNATFAPGDLIWQDEFDFIDNNKWKNEININGGYNNEFQIYDDYPDNAFVRDGVLFIKPTQSLDTVFNGNYENLYNGYISLDGCTDPPVTCSHQGAYPQINPPVVSQRLRTKGTFSFTYGRVEARIRMPSGDWTWPAFWMMPEHDVYGGWPMSGEIDISEVRGNRKLFAWGGNIGSEQTASTLHFGPNTNGLNGFMKTHGSRNTPVDQGYDRDFHLYELIWTGEMIQFKVDGNEITRITPSANGGFFELGEFPRDIPNPWRNGKNPRMAPFDENFHFILNVATGGDYFPDDSEPRKPYQGSSQPFLDFFNNRESWAPTWSGDNAAMQVDYIRVYAV